LGISKISLPAARDSRSISWLFSGVILPRHLSRRYHVYPEPSFTTVSRRITLLWRDSREGGVKLDFLPFSIVNQTRRFIAIHVGRVVPKIMFPIVLQLVNVEQLESRCALHILHDVAACCPVTWFSSASDSPALAQFHAFSHHFSHVSAMLSSSSIYHE
jgi:hypothetical protein